MTVEYMVEQEVMDGMIEITRKYRLALTALEDIDRVSHDKKEVHKILKNVFKEINKRHIFDETKPPVINSTVGEYVRASLNA